VLKRRGKAYLLTFLFILGLLVISANVPVPRTLLASSYQAYKSLVELLDLEGSPLDKAVYSVFTHNMYVMALMYIPFLGVLNAVQAIFSTGIVIKAVSIYESRRLWMLLLSTLLIPSTWLEILAYSIAVSEGTFMGIAFIRRAWRRELPYYVSFFLLSAALLLMAASLEVILIRL